MKDLCRSCNQYNFCETADNSKSTCMDYEPDYKQLQAENRRLQTIIDNRAEDLEVKAKYEALQAENDGLKDLLRRAACRLSPDDLLFKTISQELTGNQTKTDGAAEGADGAAQKGADNG